MKPLGQNMMQEDIEKARDKINITLAQILNDSPLAYQFECGRSVYEPLQPIASHKTWDSVTNRSNVGLTVLLFKKGEPNKVLKTQVSIKNSLVEIRDYPHYHPPTDLIEVYDDAPPAERQQAIATVKQYLTTSKMHFLVICLSLNRPSVYWADSWASIPNASLSLTWRFKAAKGPNRLNRLVVSTLYSQHMGMFHSIQFGKDKLVPKLENLIETNSVTILKGE